VAKNRSVSAFHLKSSLKPGLISFMEMVMSNKGRNKLHEFGILMNL